MAAAYTYDVEQLATKPHMRVRRVIGDVDVTSATTAEFADQEIDHALSVAGDVEDVASVALLEQLANKYAKAATVASGSQRINLSDIAKAYRASADAMRENSPAFGDGGAITSTAVTRVDGYSQDIPSDAVDVGAEIDPNGRREHYDWPVG